MYFPKENEILNYRYHIRDAIGCGGTANLFRGVDSKTGEKVAIKMFNPDLPTECIDRAKQEVQLSINSPYICRGFDSFDHHSCFFIVMEYIQGILLSNLIINPLPLEAVLFIGNCIAQVIQMLVDNNIVHADIKPDNIIIESKNNIPVLIDFAMYEFMFQTPTVSGGTEPFAAYELKNRSPLTETTDVYSLSGVLFQALTGNLPTPRRTFGRPHLLSIKHINEDLYELLYNGFSEDPMKRPTAAHFADVLNRIASDISGSNMPDLRFVVFANSTKPKMFNCTGKDNIMLGNFLDPSNDYISHNHARVYYENNSFMIEDLSTNGTTVNGIKISKAALKNADRIKLANVELLVCIGDKK